MSYIEHGPRIFCAGRPCSGLPLNYGDYVLPRKRSEGRLKMYDSCSDIRAWSPNPKENSRFFRELAEHAPQPGKLVPFDKLMDNIIKMSSQTQEELELVKKELEKYKSLKLTQEQKEELQKIAKSLDEVERKDQGNSEKGKSLSKIILDTFLPGSRQNEREARLEKLQKFFVTENKDVSIQVQPTVSESSVQFDSTLEKSTTKTTSDLSFPTFNTAVREGSSCCSINSGFERRELSESESEISRSAFEADIIEKDSKIIALENEVQVKNAELDEREDKIEDLRMSVRRISNVLDQKCHEVEDLKNKILHIKYENRELLDSLDNQSHVSEAQLEEIHRLRFRVNQDGELKNDLIRQLEQMKRERDGFMRKVEMLQLEMKEKNEILATQENEFQKLLQSWERSSEQHEKSKAKTTEVLKVLECEVEEKNSRISEYEAQILNFEQEVGDMYIMLKTSLSEIEFIDEHICECNKDIDENQNIFSQTKATISNYSLMVKLLETERKDLLRQLDDLKHEKENIESECQVCDAETYVNNESSTDFEETPNQSKEEIKNIISDKTEDQQLLSEISTSPDNSQAQLDSHLTEQESIIEIWNCSFDKKIDLALESHVTTSVLKIRKLAEAFKDAETEKLKEIEELKSEIKRKDFEITKLRQEVMENNSQWKGEGDCYEREKADRSKRELEMEEEIITFRHKLLGINNEYFALKIKAENLQEEKNLLLEKYEKVNQDLRFRIQDLANIEKYKRKVEEMQLRLQDLQEENRNLLEELSDTNKKIEKQNEQIQNLLDENEEVRDILCQNSDEIQSKDSEIQTLKEHNYHLNEKLQKTQENLAKLDDYKSRHNRSLEELLELQKEARKLKEEKNELENRNFDLKSDFMDMQDQNAELEKELSNIISENESLTASTVILKNQIKDMVAVEINKKKSIEFSNKLMERIISLKEKTENYKLREEERKEKVNLISKSTNTDSVIEINSLKDLSKEKDKIHLENETRQKEDEIEKLKHELDEMNSKIKNMEEKHNQTLTAALKKKEEEVKNIKNLCDQKVQKLKENFNSWNSDGFPVGTEDWLKSLSPEELLVLCQRITSMIPSDEISKTLNDTRNKYLQDDMSEKQKIVEKNELKSTIYREKKKIICKEERNKSTKLQKRLHSLSQNKGHLQMIQSISRSPSYKSLNLDEGNYKGDDFWYYFPDRNYTKDDRVSHTRSMKKRNNLEPKSFSGDESVNRRRKDFINLCSASIHRK